MSVQTSIEVRSAQAFAMNRIYRWQRHIYDLTRKYYLIGRDRMIDDLDAGPGSRVLELGCGTGRNMTVAARHYPQALFFGVDISEQMLASAGRAIRRAGLETRISTIPGDAETIDAAKRFGLPGFDRVMLPYCLSMIPGWEGTIANAISQLAPGGRVHIVDFGQFGRWPQWAGKAMRLWLSRFSVTPRIDLVGTAERLAAQHGCKVRSQCILGGYAWHIVVADGKAETKGSQR